MSDENSVKSWEENLENLRKERAKKNERILQNTKAQSTIPQFDNVFDEVVDAENVADKETVVSYYGNKSSVMPESETVFASTPVASAPEISTAEQENPVNVEDEMPGLAFEPVGEDFIKEIREERANAKAPHTEAEDKTAQDDSLSDMVEFTPVEHVFTPPPASQPANIVKPASQPDMEDQIVFSSSPAFFTPSKPVNVPPVTVEKIAPDVPAPDIEAPVPSQVKPEIKQAEVPLKTDKPVQPSTETQNIQPEISVNIAAEPEDSQEIVAQFDDSVDNNDEMFASFVLAQKTQATQNESNESVVSQDPISFFEGDLTSLQAEVESEPVVFFETDETLSDIVDSDNSVGTEDDGHLSHFPSAAFELKTIMSDLSPVQTKEIEAEANVVVDHHEPQEILPRQEIFSIPIFSIDPSRKTQPEDKEVHQAQLSDDADEIEEITEIDHFPLPSSFAMFEMEPDAKQEVVPESEDIPTMLSSEFLFMPEMLAIEPDDQPDEAILEVHTDPVVPTSEISTMDHEQMAHEQEDNRILPGPSIAEPEPEIAIQTEAEPELDAKDQLAAAVLNSQFMQVLIDALQKPVQEAVLAFLTAEMSRQTTQLVQTLEQQLPDLLKTTVETYMKENQDDIINFKEKKHTS